MGYMKKGTKEKIDELARETRENARKTGNTVIDILSSGEYITMDHERTLKNIYMACNTTLMFSTHINEENDIQENPLSSEKLEKALHMGWHKRWSERDRKKREKEKKDQQVA